MGSSFTRVVVNSDGTTHEFRELLQDELMGLTEELAARKANRSMLMEEISHLNKKKLKADLEISELEAKILKKTKSASIHMRVDGHYLQGFEGKLLQQHEKVITSSQESSLNFLGMEDDEDQTQDPS